jgi:hypothetical protein
MVRRRSRRVRRRAFSYRRGLADMTVAVVAAAIMLAGQSGSPVTVAAGRPRNLLLIVERAWCANASERVS